MLCAAAPRDQAALRLRAADQRKSASLAAQAHAASRLKQAEAREAAIAARMTKAAATLQSVQAETAMQAARLQDAERQAASAAADLAKRQAAIAAVLPVLVRLSRYPAETILAVPLPPAQATEGLLVMRGLTAQLAADIAGLEGAQAKAASQVRNVVASQAALAASRLKQMQAEASLDHQLAQTRAIETLAGKQEAEAAQAAAAQAAQAASLRDAIAAMDLAERQQAKAATGKRASGPGLALAAGHAPVAGVVLRGWGAAAEDGPATGITFAATSGAVVTAPCTGRVAFAAPFRSYGRLMIVECGRGYDFVLAGLDRLDAPVGHAVRRGEAVGRMPLGAGKPGLYLELRLDGRPVDPAPFLNAKA
jgi:septal ring factor EnvC (AmiA/AmiB activator)